jgi:S-adenosylmethionine hydrolase
MGQMDVQLGMTRISGLVNTFGERQPGEVVALFGSTGNLIVSVVNGNAAAQLNVQVGAPIRVLLRAHTTEPGGTGT